ncbi:MAG: hypothetical protein ACTSQG_06515 [Promethearchaeota archaeon]
MGFIPLKKTLKNWPKTKKFKKFFQNEKALDVINQYFKERKNWSLDIAKASSLNQGELTIKCCRAVISSELRLEELKLKDYLRKRIPDVEINKIFYKIK